MRNCDNCYHYDACEQCEEWKNTISGDFIHNDYKDCKSFADKSKIVELPCNIDDPVFVIPTKENGRKEITPMACLGFHIGRPSNTANLFDEKNKLYSAGFDMFGVSAFLTREEAEAELKKRTEKGE